MNDKELKVMEALTDVDAKYIEEAQKPAGTKPNTRRRKMIRWGASAACFGLCAAAALGFGLKNRTHNPGEFTWETRNVSDSPTATSVAEMTVVRRWKELQDQERYSVLAFNNLEYITAVSEISADAVGESLESCTLYGQDMYENDAIKETTAAVFAVANCSTDAVLAVRFEGSDSYWLYTNSGHRFDTLGQLGADLNFAGGLSLYCVCADVFDSQGEYHMVYFENVQAAWLTELIELYGTAENVVTDDFGNYGTHLMSFGLTLTSLGNGYQHSIWVTDQGYLCTNLLETGKAFYIGTEAVNKLTDKIKTECNAYENVYTAEEPTPEAAEIAGEMTEAFTSEAQQPAYTTTADPE